MKVAVCAIARLENRYIREWVEYYKDLGVDTIFLYDNNFDGEERFEDVIGDYIDSGFVVLIDYRNHIYCQMGAYQSYYDTNNNDYDWMMFFDIDEFLTFTNNEMKVKDYLSQSKFDEYGMIHINFLDYGDNGLVRYEDKPVLERFIQPIMPLDYTANYDFPENCHIKSVVRCGQKIDFCETVHTPLLDGKCCNSAGNECDGRSPFCEINITEAYLRHYRTKTIEEFINIKARRGYPDINKDHFINNSPVEDFFKFNKRTKEKIQYLEENNVVDGNVDIFVCTHKDFDNPLRHKAYKVLDSRLMNHDMNVNGVKGKYYAEIFHHLYVANNFKLKKYVGFCQYSKIFSFMNNVPDMDDIFSRCDVVAISISLVKYTNKELYETFHNINDLYIVGNIINNKYNKYYKDYVAMLNSRDLFAFNMFIMKKGDFLNYIDFIKNVLDDYLEAIDYDIEKYILKNKEIYSKDGHSYAILGTLSERLTDIYIRHHFNTVLSFDITHF